ncbi:MAG: hypothetical protein GXP25_20475 [Planctomycetes bacterium]|nr:hypothetical protein [Planctomycetota bacterium]
MTSRLSPRLLLHLRWLVLTIAVGLVSVGVYESAAAEPRIGGTLQGLSLGILAALVIVFASCYGVRRQVGLRRLQDTVGRIDPERERRLAELNERVADLQVAGRKAGESTAGLVKAARAAVREAGLARQIRVELLADGQRTVLQLVPREHPGRLENWLLAHQYLGILVVLLIVLHAGFRFLGALATVTAVLALTTVLSGGLLSLLYVIGPRVLVRVETTGGDDGAKAAVLIRLIAAALMLHVAFTGALVGALAVHVLSILYY